MEEAGQCRRGYFVEGLGAAQFALPGAVDRMRALAAAVRDGALGRITVERADGGGVHDSPLARALESAGFRPTPRGPRLRAG